MAQLRILFVDDDENLLHAIRLSLRRCEHKLSFARGGREALARLEEHSFDVLVSDARMPDLDGVTLVVEAKTRWPDMIRIMLTGEATLADAARAVNEGKVAAFLAKPYAAAELIRVVESLAADAGLDRDWLGSLDREMVATLSQREREILVELLGGKRLSQIADALCISRHTVRNHLRSVFQKLGVHSQVELLNKAQLGRSAGENSSSDADRTT